MKGGVFALGNFDGVHRGHRAVIDASIEKARFFNTRARVLTFEPHPRTVFQPHLLPFLLTPLAVKERLLKALNVQDIVVLPFTQKFSELSAQDFVQQILVEQMGAEHIVAGHDFVFGHKRGGDMKKLAAWLTPHNIGVTEVSSLGGEGEVFSSSSVRELLLQGEVKPAAEILGREWSMTGKVIEGLKRGRTIGIPTANISLGDYLRPKFGVYAIRAGKAGEPLMHKGVANIGLRPTVGGKSENLEAYLFDFKRDIYGEEWEFALVDYIRPEQKFDNLDQLKMQISHDIKAASAIFSL